MKKLLLLTALFMLPWIAQAQNVAKPFNKGNFKIDVNYSRLQQKRPSFYYSDFRGGAGYGITDWCVVGVFGSFGMNKVFVITGGETVLDDTVSYIIPAVLDSQIDRYFRYGLQAEVHPLSVFWPSFYFVDLYLRGELGMRTISEKYIPENGKPYVDRAKNNFLYGGSVGLAINPSRYFGLFYEMAYDNLNKKTNDPTIGSQKPKRIQRFGLNVRFGGPKKWRE
jgi:hypothetical protein